MRNLDSPRVNPNKLCFPKMFVLQRKKFGMIDSKCRFQKDFTINFFE